jgi:long-chain acyl-CoA synthetase
VNANLFGLIAQSIDSHPQQLAIKAGETSLTYSQLDTLSARAAALMRDAGVRPGDRVGVMLPNVPAFAIAYYGALRAGAVIVPMNTMLKAREIRFYLGDPEVSLLFAWHGARDEVDAGAAGLDTTVVYVAPGEFDDLLSTRRPVPDVAQREADDTAVILYTSGTTGKPKGAELSHANLTRNAQASLELFGLRRDDVVIGALPLFHSFGQTCSLNAVLSAGAQLSMIARFEPGAVLQTVERDGATAFMGVPTMYTALLHHPELRNTDTSTLRLSVSGGAALPVDVLHGFERTLAVPVLEGYGLSETSPLASFNRPDRRKAGTIGVAIPGVEMKVVDEQGGEVMVGDVGEIAIRGHNVMKGYWRRPEETAAVLSADGWFRTGDMGRTDEEGFFTIVDRKKELIIRGGYNVYPREIEEVLYEHPDVRECAVVGIPHAALGEEVGAAVVLTDSGSVTADELREYVKVRVAAYKYPRHLWFLRELPKGPTNKILKREIAIPDEVKA